MAFVEWDPKARDFLRKLPQTISKRIYKKVDEEIKNNVETTKFHSSNDGWLSGILCAQMLKNCFAIFGTQKTMFFDELPFVEF